MLRAGPLRRARELDVSVAMHRDHLALTTKPRSRNSIQSQPAHLNDQRAGCEIPCLRDRFSRWAAIFVQLDTRIPSDPSQTT